MITLNCYGKHHTLVYMYIVQAQQLQKMKFQQFYFICTLFFTNLCKPLIWSEYFKNKLKDFCEVYRLNKLKTDFTTWRRKTLEGCLKVFEITLHDCTLQRKILRGSEILSSRLQFNLDVPFNSLDLDIQLSKLLTQVQNWFSPGCSAKIALHCVPVIFMIQ